MADYPQITSYFPFTLRFCVCRRAYELPSPGLRELEELLSSAPDDSPFRHLLTDELGRLLVVKTLRHQTGPDVTGRVRSFTTAGYILEMAVPTDGGLGVFGELQALLTKLGWAVGFPDT